MSSRLPPRTRPETPQHNLRLTHRDRAILEALHAFDGLLSIDQIDRLFFSGKGGSHPRDRMRVLFHHRYVNTPAQRNIHRVPLGETIYYLDTRGAEMVAGLRGETLNTFKYRREPRWSMIDHDLGVSDFRIAVLQACQSLSYLHLHTWLTDQEFLAYPDMIEYTSETGKKRRRRIRPDAFFMLKQEKNGLLHRAEEFAYLLELDRATEDNPRFAREKVLPGLAYLKSQRYHDRFGTPYGRFLVVTTTEQRMNNLRSQTRRAGDRGQFYFTTFEKVTSATVLTAPIWLMTDRDTPFSLFH